MTDSTYIVTGASSGLGLAIASMLLQNNHTVIGIGRHVTSCALANNKNFLCTRMDFSQLQTSIAAMEELKPSVKQLSGIICCAGFGKFGALEQLSHQQILDQLNVNLTAHIMLCKTFVPLLKQQRSGNILFIGSDAALRGTQQGSIYCASKFALRGFSQALRQECSRNHVRVGIINPGMLDTPFYNNLAFKPGPSPENTIDIDTLCDTVQLIINSPSQLVFDEITISPLKHVVEKK
ncbi:MAG: SDR family oxidoreductase [Thiohalomonadales bacterium]